MKIECRCGAKAHEPMPKLEGNAGYTKMSTNKHSVLVFLFVVAHTSLLNKTSSPLINANLSIFATYLTKDELLWSRCWNSRFSGSFLFYRQIARRETALHGRQFYRFFAAKKRQKYYRRLLKLKRAYQYFHAQRKRIPADILKKYHHFLRQLRLIRKFGIPYRLYKPYLKRQPFNFFISYDTFYSPRLRAAIWALQRKKFHIWKALFHRKKRRLRPWRFYKLRRTKIKARTKIVHFGSLRVKRFIRNTGLVHFVTRYNDILLRWRTLLLRKHPTFIGNNVSYSPYVNYLSAITYNPVKDFGFYRKIFYVFFNKKKNNYYLTLTNGFGEVLLYHSSGRFLKFRRNKKLRASLLNLPGLLGVFVKRIVRRKINTISKLYRPAGMSKRALKTVYNIFNGAGVVIKTLVKNTKRSHGLLKKTKKIRRL